MTILKIKQGADPYLKRKSIDVKEGEDLTKLADDMIETMLANNGIGLAANQVGVLKRIIVDNCCGTHIIINPVITRIGLGKMKNYEGCLSYPGERVKVSRYKIITVEGFDINWNPVKIKARNRLAIVLQHEIDHLDGVTI